MLHIYIYIYDISRLRVNSLTNLVNSLTNLVNSLTNLVNSLTNLVNSLTNLVNSLTNLVNSLKNLDNSLTNLVLTNICGPAVRFHYEEEAGGSQRRQLTGTAWGGSQPQGTSLGVRRLLFCPEEGSSAWLRSAGTQCYNKRAQYQISLISQFQRTNLPPMVSVEQ